MTREIKFRAWDKKNLIMNLLDFLIIPTNGKALEWFDDGNTGGTLDHVVIMQYTGLKDKNGKEIYEGDIINGLDTDTRFGQYYNNMEVDFYAGEFGISDGLGHLGIKHLTDIEIIGDIYQNPELLNE